MLFLTCSGKVNLLSIYEKHTLENLFVIAMKPIWLVISNNSLNIHEEENYNINFLYNLELELI